MIGQVSYSSMNAFQVTYHQAMWHSRVLLQDIKDIRQRGAVKPGKQTLRVQRIQKNHGKCSSTTSLSKKLVKHLWSAVKCSWCLYGDSWQKTQQKIGHPLHFLLGRLFKAEYPHLPITMHRHGNCWLAVNLIQWAVKPLKRFSTYWQIKAEICQNQTWH